MKIQDIIKIIRKKNLRQIEIARKIGVGQPSISRFMNGKGGIGDKKILKLCLEFGIPFNDNTKSQPPGFDDLKNAIDDLLFGKSEEQVKELTKIIKSIKRL